MREVHLSIVSMDVNITLFQTLPCVCIVRQAHWGRAFRHFSNINSSSRIRYVVGGVLRYWTSAEASNRKQCVRLSCARMWSSVYTADGDAERFRDSERYRWASTRMHEHELLNFEAHFLVNCRCRAALHRHRLFLLKAWEKVRYDRFRNLVLNVHTKSCKKILIIDCGRKLSSLLHASPNCIDSERHTHRDTDLFVALLLWLFPISVLSMVEQQRDFH